MKNNTDTVLALISAMTDYLDQELEPDLDVVERWRDQLESVLASSPQQPAAVDDAAALEDFTAYFVKNYPGPDTIIGDPKWHAPRIFRAAQRALAAQQPADALGGVRELVARCRAEADAAYVAYIRKMDTDECRGWEAKVRAGTFARANLDAFTAAAELLSRSRALHAFASRLEAALAARPQEVKDDR